MPAGAFWRRLLPELPVPEQRELVRPVRLAFYGGLAGFAVSLYATFNALVLAPRFSDTILPDAWRVVPLGFGVLYLTGLVVLRRGHSVAGRLALVVVACLHVLVLGVLIGVEPGTPFLALVLVIAAPLVFARSERRWMLLTLALAAGAVVAMQIVAAHRPPVVEISPAYLLVTRLLVLGLASVLAILALASNNRLVEIAQDALAREKQRSEALLLNILPEPVAERLKRGINPLADGFNNVTVLFADIVGFTSFASDRTPEQVVSVLNEIFSGFDLLAEQHGVEKIKTIGDAYMIGSGLPTPRRDHAVAAAEMALGMLDQLRVLAEAKGEVITVRIGIHSGRVVAGVIGNKKFAYDLWGDTVNVASRIEASGAESRIHVSEDSYELLRDRYDFEPRGATALKGRGDMNTYFLLGRKRTA